MQGYSKHLLDHRFGMASRWSQVGKCLSIFMLVKIVFSIKKRLVAGSVCGAVLVFESVLRRTVWQDKFEMTYVAPSQVLLKSMQDASVDAMVIESQMGLEIEDIRIMGNIFNIFTK